LDQGNRVAVIYIPRLAGLASNIFMKPEQWTLSGVFSGVRRIGGMAAPIVQALICSITTVVPNRNMLNS